MCRHPCQAASQWPPLWEFSRTSHERAQTYRHGPQRRQAVRDGCAPDLGGRAPGLRRVTTGTLPTRISCRFRAGPRTRCLNCALPRAARHTRLRAAQHGNREPGAWGHLRHHQCYSRARHQPAQRRRLAGPRRGADHAVESQFGSFHMVDGFILNNQLTDFSAEPAGPDGVPVPNRVEPGKRPRSTDGTHADIREVRRSTRPVVRDGGLPRRRGDHPVRRENRCRNGRLGYGPHQAVGIVDFGAANSPKTNLSGEHPRSIRPTTATTTRWCKVCASSATVPPRGSVQRFVCDRARPIGWIGGADRAARGW